MSRLRSITTLIIALAALLCRAADAPDGFQNARWGMPPDSVRSAAGVNWQPSDAANGFPAELKVTTYTASTTIAGYPAQVCYYFFENRFFQATITFNFNSLKSFDFNYNVFISVDRYYRAIHDQTLTFVYDVYDLLAKKYGKKEPVFEGLDPRYIFKATDAYLRQEQWNLRYHPYEYYKRIVCAAYARWDFPRTRAIFAVNISAADQRFDYTLSLTSLDQEEAVNQKKDSLRMSGL
jgi:hypothetical protein